MTRFFSAALLAAFCLSTTLAQARDVPVERDLKREERIERRIDPNRPPPDSSVSPDNPDGVVGFDALPPTDPMDGGVDQDSPLPPGSPGDIDRN